MRSERHIVLPLQVPEGYRLGIDGAVFSRDKLEEKLPGGTRKLLTLDISIPSNEFVERVNQGAVNELASRVDEFYHIVCPNNCPGCFEKGEVKNPLLTWKDVKDYIEQALWLGLESVKFLGPGELIMNQDLFEILDYFQQRGIKISIFTRGYILENDTLAEKSHKMKAARLVNEICKFDVVRILIGYKSRRAISYMIKEGMNSNLYCQRLMLCTNPVTEDNIGEVLEVFKWGAERNIPVFVTPTMLSGKGNSLVKYAQKPEFQEKLIQLYTDIYLYLIHRGIMSLGQLEEEGVSSYAGIAPCNQLSCGMYIRKDGVVLRCPGEDSESSIVADDVRKQPLRDIWVGSVNYKLGPVFNNRCVKDGVSIPARLYDSVLKRVKERLK